MGASVPEHNAPALMVWRQQQRPALILHEALPQIRAQASNRALLAGVSNMLPEHWAAVIQITFQPICAHNQQFPWCPASNTERAGCGTAQCGVGGRQSRAPQRAVGLRGVEQRPGRLRYSRKVNHINPHSEGLCDIERQSVAEIESVKVLRDMCNKWQQHIKNDSKYSLPATCSCIKACKGRKGRHVPQLL
eukprot:1154520-Pelagomonas_calceolata.AAC.9